MIYNRDILKSALHVLDYYGESIRFDIERLEEALSEENHYLLDESYLFVQAMKLGLYDAIIFDEDADRFGYIHYLVEEHQFSEQEAVFMVAVCLSIVDKMGYYFEIPDLSKMLEMSYASSNLGQLSIIARTYFDGFGVKQDYEKAFEIYSYLYSEQDQSGASYLGYMYEYGLGVEQDLEKAYMYYSNSKDDLCFYYFLFEHN
jgi:TPR repeat protein